MPAPRVLTERELNRALLARQMLLERASIPIPRALERMGFLQDQYAPSGYVGLWCRVAAFRREAPFGPALTHFDEAAAYALIACVVGWGGR